MAVRIRLQRHGRKKRPFYRLVAADARSQRDGVCLERLGHYDPMTDPADVFIDEEKALKWLRRGGTTFRYREAAAQQERDFDEIRVRKIRKTNAGK